MFIVRFLVLTLLQAQVSDSELHYRLTVPDGFEALASAQASNPDIMHCWADRSAAAAQPQLVMCVLRMRGVLPPDAMKPDEVPAGSQLVSYPWRTFRIQGLRTLESQNGESVVALVAQVPLRQEAIQLTFAGPADQEARADSLMRVTLASLDGETNWLTSAERSARLGRAAGVWIAIGAALVLVLYLRRRRAAA